MSKRVQTTYHFSCDVPGCKATKSDHCDSYISGWLRVEIQESGDRKERHYCTEHKDTIMVALGLAKPKAPEVAATAP